MKRKKLKKPGQLLARIDQYLKEEGQKLEESIEDDVQKVPYTAEDLMIRVYNRYLDNTKDARQAEQEKNLENGKLLDNTPEDVQKKVKAQQERRNREAYYAPYKLIETMKPSEIRAQHELNEKNKIVAYGKHNAFNSKTATYEVEGIAARNNVDITGKALDIIHKNVDKYMQEMRANVCDVLATEKSLSKEMKQQALAMLLVCNMTVIPPDSARGQIIGKKYVFTEGLAEMRSLRERMAEQFLENGVHEHEMNKTFEDWATKMMDSKDFKKTFAKEAVLDKTLNTIVTENSFLTENKLLNKVFKPESLLVNNSKVAEKNSTLAK